MMTEFSTAFAAAVESLAAKHSSRGSRIGVQIRDAGTNEVLYERLADELFPGASTAKILTCAAALAALGPDYRFETSVSRTGRVDRERTLHGDLILRAGGDPNLSARADDRGKLRYCDVDHALAGYYPGADTIAGDPVRVLRELARAVAAGGIERVRGRVLADASLFSEGEFEAGTHTAISPFVVNDNLVDVRVAASRIGEPPHIAVSPAARSFTVVNNAVAVEPGSGRTALTIAERGICEQGVRTLEVRGEIDAGCTTLLVYRVPEPSIFARMLFVQALEEAGVTVEQQGGFDGGARVLIASYRSAPLSEAVRVVLKVSQNLHAEVLLRVLKANGLPLCPFPGIAGAGAFLGDGCGAKAHFTPAFMCEFLAAVRNAPWGDHLLRALPILGCDGTLHAIQRDTGAAAARAVRAKTGTLSYTNLLARGALMESKALAGFITAASGRELIFAVFFSNVPFEDERDPDGIGNAVASIAVAAYEQL